MFKPITAAIVLAGLILTGCSSETPAPAVSSASPSPTPSPNEEMVEVPDVVGLDGQAAADELEAVGLTSEANWNGDAVASGITFDVVATDPASGTEIAPGSVVTVDLDVPPLPTYASELDNDTYVVTLDVPVTDREAGWIVLTLKSQTDNDGGYFVQFNCSTGGTTSKDNRVANGKFAIGDQGAATVGLVSDHAYEGEAVDDAVCPAPMSAPVASSVAASDVVAAFGDAGLPVTDPRDNTATNCPDLGCAELITTDDITVMTFPDETAAEHVAEVYGEDGAYRSGLVVLSYLGARTPDDARPEYEDIVTELQEQ